MSSLLFKLVDDGLQIRFGKSFILV